MRNEDHFERRWQGTRAWGAEIQDLMAKYAGGQMPPLTSEDDPRSGLIDGGFLGIYHAGLATKHSVPLGILLPANEYDSVEDRWLNGYFVFDRLVKPEWRSFCHKLRDSEAGDEICVQCDKRHAVIAEKKGHVIAYLCDSGLIDFAVPISVRDQIVAMFFCGQFRPHEGSVWNPELVERGGIFRSLSSGEEGVEVWDEIGRRLAESSRETGISEDVLFQYLDQSPYPDRIPPIVTTPAEVQLMAEQVLEDTRNHLSDLATYRYESEKGKLVDWMWAQVTSSLEPLSVTPVDTAKAWEQLSSNLRHVAEYFDLDFVLLLLWGDEGVKILCETGLSGSSLDISNHLPASEADLATLQEVTDEAHRPLMITRNEYTGRPVFDRLFSAYEGEANQLLVLQPIHAPLEPAAEPATAAYLLGRLTRDAGSDGDGLDDGADLERIISGVEMVAQTILLVEQLKSKTLNLEQAAGELEKIAGQLGRFLEDVSHNIHTPIQNIIVEAATLADIPEASERSTEKARALASQARRLHIMSDRVWILVNIEQGRFERLERERVNVYDIVMGHRKSLVDLADQKGVKILVDPPDFREREDRENTRRRSGRGQRKKSRERERERDKIKNWPPIQTDRTLLSQAILNLLDNAVKYSSPDTEIRIEGKRTTDEVTLSFGNVGIPIREKDRGNIFKRYYRTDEARRCIQAGTGIGLSIVQAFVDLCCERPVDVTSTFLGGNDYLTVFRLHIPLGRQ